MQERPHELAALSFTAHVLADQRAIRGIGLHPAVPATREPAGPAAPPGTTAA